MASVVHEIAQSLQIVFVDNLEENSLKDQKVHILPVEYPCEQTDDNTCRASQYPPCLFYSSPEKKTD